MNDTIIFILGLRITAWKLVGFSGVFLFTSRWFVQMWASKRAGKPTVPRLFWIISIAGSILCLLYFIFGKNDSVGILAYLFPCAVSSYNLYLDINHNRKEVAGNNA